MPRAATDPESPAATRHALRFILWFAFLVFAGFWTYWFWVTKPDTTTEAVWATAGYIRALAFVVCAYFAARAVDLLLRP